MEQMLGRLYDSMMPLVAQFVTLGRAVGCIGALIFISSRVWGHIARAEPIDIYPLMRPFLIGLAILLFPQLLGGLRGITGAIARSTDSVRITETQEIARLQQQKKDIMARLPAYQDFATDEAYEAKLKELGGVTGMGNLGQQTALTFNKLKYDVNQNFREWMKNVLELFHCAARLLINVLATFLLVVLSVLGPLSFGISIFPGFTETIPKWLGNFITISLWVPVANIFGAIMGQFQIMMLRADITRLQSPNGGLESADFGYLVFLCIAITGYLIIPFVTEMMISATGAAQAGRAMQSAMTGGAAVAGAAGGASLRGAGSIVSNGATGLGAAVGAGQGLLGGNSGGSMTRGEQIGHRAGTAVRERAQSLVNRLRG
ncbi:conjugative transposon protein TraJ [Hymenobacter sp. YC55]|uniref:conjugative transposon protein TraJ n=1 Tax=Hymenobacter sp. YC55 TaxID=3034019 RepID=UPI0023F85889|nr:conjugative transposon protein TraJ [Hymenobacter sp. YC55]MDF7813921.1 conjugative transposon protein TraJ [Hymenobacter sp. YC55]